MPDTSAAEIWIGGTIAEADLDTLIAGIIEDSAGTEWDGPLGGVDAWKAFIRFIADTGLPLILNDVTAPDGQFENLEEALHSLGLTYKRHDDGNSAWSPAVVFWEPGMDAPREWISMVDRGVPHLSAASIENLWLADTFNAEIRLMKRVALFDMPLVILTS
jgi:hypothetical protein